MHAAKQVRSVSANLFGLVSCFVFFLPKKRLEVQEASLTNGRCAFTKLQTCFFFLFSVGLGLHKKVSTVLTVSLFSGLCNLTQNFMRVRVTWSNWFLSRSACNCIQLIPLWFKFLSIYWSQTMGAVSSWYLLCIQPQPYRFLLYSVPPTSV